MLHGDGENHTGSYINVSSALRSVETAVLTNFSIQRKLNTDLAKLSTDLRCFEKFQKLISQNA